MFALGANFMRQSPRLGKQEMGEWGFLVECREFCL